MKGPLDRAKVLLRHLPPTISQSTLMQQIDSVFSGRYNWLSFRPGKNSLKRNFYSRAYIDFNTPEDVIEFAEFFHGHVFVNEKGTQFRTIVEYSPSQRVPKTSKKDGREGTIFKDPEYMEFLEFISKPIENLPSAEIQLERKDAERAGAVMDNNIVTPLMDFVRKKREEKNLSRKSLSAGKQNRKLPGEQGGFTSLSSSKRGHEKKKISSKMYVQRDPGKASSTKDKQTYILASKRDDQQLSNDAATATRSEARQQKGVCGLSDGGDKKVLLLKGGDREISFKNDTPSFTQDIHDTSVSKQNQSRDGRGKIIRSILLKDPHHYSVAQSELRRRPPRSSNLQSMMKDVDEISMDKGVGQDSLAAGSDRPDRRKSKDINDSSVWAPLRRSDARVKSLAPPEGISGDAMDVRIHGAGRGGRLLTENGSHKLGKSGSQHGMKDVDGSSIEMRSSKRGPPSYGSHEKQVWVQKSSASC